MKGRIEKKESSSLPRVANKSFFFFGRTENTRQAIIMEVVEPHADQEKKNQGWQEQQ